MCPWLCLFMCPLMWPFTEWPSPSGCSVAARVTVHVPVHNAVSGVEVPRSSRVPILMCPFLRAAALHLAPVHVAGRSCLCPYARARPRSPEPYASH